MKQFEINGNTLTLKVKKSPMLIRYTMLFFALISFLGPILGILSAKKLHLGFFIMIGIFGLIGFYLLRVFLWNTYGKETFRFTADSVYYEADYKWFKDAKAYEKLESLEFEIEQVGYLEEHKGVLVLSNDEGEKSISSVIKIPIDSIEGIIKELKEKLQLAN